MPSSIEPSIGRRVWYWTSQVSGGVNDVKQAYDAGITYVHPDGRVNLLTTDHEGNQSVAQRVDLRDPSADDQHGVDNYATWMPYQVKAAAGEAGAVDVAAPTKL